MAEQALRLDSGLNRDPNPAIIIGALEPRALGEVAQTVASVADQGVLETLAQNIIIARAHATEVMRTDSYWEDLVRDIAGDAEHIGRTCRQLDLGSYTLRKSGLAVPNPNYTPDGGLQTDRWLWVSGGALREAHVNTGPRTKPADMPAFALLTMRIMFREKPKANEVTHASYDLTKPGSTVPRHGFVGYGRRFL